MPIYEYQCECGNETEVRLSFEYADQSQICECGKVMRRKMSLSSFMMKPTGKGMALDSLNSREGGMPNGSKRAWAQHVAGAGL